jgi:hypothetical protein
MLCHHCFDETISWCFHRQVQCQSWYKCEHHISYVTVNLKPKYEISMQIYRNNNNNFELSEIYAY